jgi:predicted transcriptional regulator
MEEGEISRANCFAEAATLDATQQLPGDAAGLIGIAIHVPVIPMPSQCRQNQRNETEENWPLVRKTDVVVALPRWIGDMNKTRFSKAETRILEQFWKLGTCSVREILDSLPEEERVAYTTVQTLVYRLEQKGALRKVKKIGNAQLFEPAIDQNEYRSGLVRDLLDLFGGSPRILVSNLLETGTITLKDLKALQNAAPGNKNSRSRGGKGHA